MSEPSAVPRPAEVRISQAQADALSAASAITDALRHNIHAASSYVALRQAYAREIVRARIAQISDDRPTESAANHDARRATRAARALLIGLAVQREYTASAAEEAAYMLTDGDFAPGALLVPPTSEPRRVYVSEAPADEYTREVATARVLYEGYGRTAYLFSEADARAFQTRTGLTLTAL